ncbi:unnamed protein product [Clonostachys solani]|uniref:Peptidase M1 leukotriene A4 hydrolase/aminopeptidase C-terminal domain-containing protein n=1 Tax=Clonostachys solani TaxID=160281 RepID=A0A9N9ZJL1_9HYPO|nr:unnamed protein product [Clonostachys solani]
MSATLQRQRDINSYADPTSVTTTHTDIHLDIDFERQVVSGKTSLTLSVVDDTAIKHVVLDTAYLKIGSVLLGEKPLEWELQPWSEPNGRALHIRLADEQPNASTFTLTVTFETEAGATGLQWFQPSQTDDKTHPFMFSQCEPVHARTIFPCQDTPAIKTTFDITIRSILPVVASGIPRHDLLFSPVAQTNTPKTYTFNQPIPISNYLFSVASGNLTGEKIGDRSYVYCSPGDLEACTNELRPDLGTIISAAENLIHEYPWPLYNLVILPKSFHLGGMENPVFNFYSATVISGDRENINVVAHEFAHTYSGNLVTNASWEHFWLNEGWAVYIERYILKQLKGQEYKDFAALVGWEDLVHAVEAYGGSDSPFTKLVLEFQGKRPDDIMSVVQYEKGFIFLSYLEQIVGENKWHKFVPHYFKTFSKKAVDSEEFKKCVQDFFSGDEEAKAQLKAVDWDTWLHAPGLPPRPNIRSVLHDQCLELANQWISLCGDETNKFFSPSSSDVEGWTVGQQLVLLETLISASAPLPAQAASQLGAIYKFSSSTNLEVLSRYLRVALRAKDPKAVEQTQHVLGQTGRMKFVRPL